MARYYTYNSIIIELKFSLSPLLLKQIEEDILVDDKLVAVSTRKSADKP